MVSMPQLSRSSPLFFPPPPLTPPLPLPLHPPAAQLPSLTDLDLTNNRMERLLEEIGQLVGLRRLILQSNRLELLPDEIGELTNLTQLDLRSNKLTALPPSIANLGELVKLDLSYNQLTELPPAMCELTKLETFDLKNCPLITPPAPVIKKGLAAIMDYLRNALEDLEGGSSTKKGKGKNKGPEISTALDAGDY